jgi:hypothetical protein
LIGQHQAETGVRREADFDARELRDDLGHQLLVRGHVVFGFFAVDPPLWHLGLAAVEEGFDAVPLIDDVRLAAQRALGAARGVPNAHHAVELPAHFVPVVRHVEGAHDVAVPTRRARLEVDVKAPPHLVRDLAQLAGD